MAQKPETLQTCANIGGTVAHMVHRNWWSIKALRAWRIWKNVYLATKRTVGK